MPSKKDEQDAEVEKKRLKAATKAKARFLADLAELFKMVALGFEPHQHEEMLRHRAVLAAKRKVEKAKLANLAANDAVLKGKLEEAYLKAAASMSKKEVAAYKDCGIKITGSTLPMKARPVINTATATRPDSGAVSLVFEIKIEEKGSENVWFAKPFANTAEQRVEYGEEIAGIELQSLNRAARSLATSALAAHMGWDVVSKSKMAVGTVDGKETPILLSKAVKGKMAADCDLSAFDNEAVISAAVQMQIIDIITGQTDRHIKNFFIDMSGAKPSLAAIDHDQSHGPKIVTADGTSRFDTTGTVKPTRDGKGLPYNGKEPPPVIDKAMQKAINRLTDASITFLLGDNFTKPEIDAAKKRLASLQAWIASPQCKVIEATEWGTADVRSRQTEFNSYTAHAKVDIPKRVRGEFDEKLNLFRGFNPPDTAGSWLDEYDVAAATSLADARAVIVKATTKYPIMTDVIGLKKCAAIDELFGKLKLSKTACTDYSRSAPSDRVGLIKSKCRDALHTLATRRKLTGNTITAADFEAVVDKALTAALMDDELAVLSNGNWLLSNVNAPIVAFAKQP